MKKKLLAITLTGVMMIGFNSTVLANDFMEGNETVTIQRYEMVGDNQRDASWGYMDIHSKNPIGQTPSAYAATRTYSGNVHKVQAHMTVLDSNGNSEETSLVENQNTNEAISATIKSKTEKCTFTGYGAIQSNSTSGWQSVTGSAEY